MKKIGQLQWVLGRVFTILDIFPTISGYVRGTSGNVVFHENYGFCGVIFNSFLTDFDRGSFLIAFSVIWNADL